MRMILAVALGGAVGSVARYLMMGWVGRLAGTGFPWGTLAVNVLGAVAMGALVEAAGRVWAPSPEIRALLTVGVLGGFTTFSTFSADAAQLLQRGDTGLALAYGLASVVLCVGGLFLGLMVMKAVAG
ncbi:MAG TPA: fluoride efflux transporter CrcB [Azospirillaceae bacterium]|nr:fluoride efflux transporter CrcB [Azospirillaceae bacterium]